MAPKRTLEEKLELIEKLECGLRVAQLGVEYLVAKQTVSDVRKSKEKPYSFVTKSTSTGEIPSKSFVM